MMSALILPGNDHTQITDNWYQSVKAELEALGLNVIAEDMPDPKAARMEYWIPFIEEKIGSTDNSILIGHSTGAIAAMRYLEDHKCRCIVLVSCYYTDLGDELEKEGGYFNVPWKWDHIRENTEKIVIFASSDDPYIPISEPRYVKGKLDPEYHEYKGEGHFNKKTEFPELVEVVKRIANIAS